VHQGTKPYWGKYTYTVTPRYFKNGLLLALDKNLSVKLDVEVAPFIDQRVELGFTRGFVQSQAFVHHFGPKAVFRPAGKQLIFDTTKVAGKNPQGEKYTWQQQYEWLGFTAREKVMNVLNSVVADKNATVDVFAYDLNEPDVLNLFLQLAPEGRIRIILDNATLHHDSAGSTAEDQFEKLFSKKAKNGSGIKRGKFGRFAHDKIFVVSKNGKPVQVLTGSTNFSVTGLYVNSNHVLVFNDEGVAKTYSEVFNEAWNDDVKGAAFAKSAWAGKAYSFNGSSLPKFDVTFSPHNKAFAAATLGALARRIDTEKNSVFFAVMALTNSTGPVLPALVKLHSRQDVFSYGISDSPGGIFMYKPGKRSGLLVSGKPAASKLPKPFDQVPSVGKGHQVHHKFVVCDFNGKKPVVYCGSSNLALGGEQANGDNLLAIYDADVATVFALEAMALVDHFNFLDSKAGKVSKAKTGAARTKALKTAGTKTAAEAGWFLSTNDKWSAPYFDKNDLHCADRELFGA
jgi:hypothetical protein